jgi:hypothetical protein
MATEKDKMVQDLIKKVQGKKEEISKAEKPQYETNLSFRYNKDSSASVNIQVTSDVDELVGIAAFLLEREASFEKANELLGTKSKFSWLNFTRDQWIHDLRLRINKIQIAEKKKELADMEKVLDSMISKELRDQMALEEIMKKLES